MAAHTVLVRCVLWGTEVLTIMLGGVYLMHIVYVILKSGADRELVKIVRVGQPIV